MMGLSFFITQAEYLKSLASLNDAPTIEPSGYPGIKLRLSIIFAHLSSLTSKPNPFSFLHAYKRNSSARFLSNYLSGWRRELEDPKTISKEKSTKRENKESPEMRLETLLENAIRRAIPKLSELAIEIIPDDKCAHLSRTFFSRIRYLGHDLPPACSTEGDNSFSEILSAAWAYQLQFGEFKESRKEAPRTKFAEYKKTCRLVLKAIELIPVCGSPVLSPSDIQEPLAFLKRITEESDAISAALHRQLNRKHKNALVRFGRLNEASTQLQTFLARCLNKVIRGESIYSREIFKDINLRPETKQLLAQTPKAENVARLNRWLLEDAYPVELWKNPVWSAGGIAPELEGSLRGLKLSARGRGVQNLNCLLERIKLPAGHRASVRIVPFKPQSLKTVALTLHLGNWFSIARKTRLGSFEIDEPDSERLMANLAREEIFIHHGKRFLIHPGDLVLGVTLEFIALPGDLMAYVEGKSRIGRMGLIIATASKIDPGFHGVVVLELANAGTVPLEVKPGSVIGQLVFHRLSKELKEDELYRDEYYCQIKP